MLVPVFMPTSTLSPFWLLLKWWTEVSERTWIEEWETLASLRLRKLRELAAARKTADATLLILRDPSKPSLSSRGWMLYTQLRFGLPLCPVSEILKCPGLL